MTVYRSISVSKWFSDNISLAGFGNPTKNAVMSIRELLENSLDSAEGAKILPDIVINVTQLADEPNVYEVKVFDNGAGVPKEYIPQAFGKVLFGSKFGMLKQHRGLFGAGGKLVLINAQRETRMPFTVISATLNSDKIYSFTMEIDINKNEPIIYEFKEVKNTYNWHGVILRFYSKADFVRAQSYIVKYLKLTSIVCPYANLKYVFNGKEVFSYKRVSDLMPEPPVEVKPHPHGVDAETIRELIVNCKDDIPLSVFLTKCFQRVGYRTAKSFLEHYKIEDVNVKSLSDYEISKLSDYLREYNDFISPSTECLSPITEDIMRQGVMLNFNPPFFCYSSRKGVYGGHPFIIEVAVAYGNKQIESLRNNDNFILYRYANRIPLLYDESACVTRKVLNEIVGYSYGLTQEDTVLFIVNICSTKIPYKTIGKESISDSYETINHTLKLCYQDVLRKLRDYISQRKRYEYNVKRKALLRKYLEHISFFVSDTLNKEKVNIDELVKRLER